MQTLQKLLFSLPLWVLAAQAQTLAITHANVIDTVSGTLQSDTTVVIDGNRITRVAHSTRRNPKAAQVIDAHSAYLIPGLWDMHTHVYFDSTAADGTDIILPLFLANGITGTPVPHFTRTCLMTLRYETAIE